jgi:hypothetical protein
MCREEPFGAMIAAGDLPILTLNEDALAFWKLCDGNRTVEDIEGLLLAEYEVGELRHRILEFVRYALESGILVLLPDVVQT